MNRAEKRELKAYLMRLRCEWSICAESGVFGFVSAAASRWETDLCLFERMVMWEERPLQERERAEEEEGAVPGVR